MYEARLQQVANHRPRTRNTAFSAPDDTEGQIGCVHPHIQEYLLLDFRAKCVILLAKLFFVSYVLES
jgi:hypothetical protein